MWRKGNPSALLGMQTGAAAVENSMEFPQKSTNGTAFWPVIPLLGIYPKNPETPVQKNQCIPVFIAVLFTVAKCWKQPKCPSVDEWIKKLWYIYTMKYYSTEKKKEFLPFATAWLGLETIMLREISQLMKDKHRMISLWKESNEPNIWRKIYEQNRTRDMGTWNRLTAARGEGWRVERRGKD